LPARGALHGKVEDRSFDDPDWLPIATDDLLKALQVWGREVLLPGFHVTRAGTFSTTKSLPPRSPSMKKMSFLVSLLLCLAIFGTSRPGSGVSLGPVSDDSAAPPL
jgi:hypothetical protein